MQDSRNLCQFLGQSLHKSVHMFAKRSLHFLYFQERANIRGKLASTGRDVIELSFAEMASLAGNCFELTDGTKKFLAISKRAQVRSGDVGRIQNSHYNIPLPNQPNREYILVS